MHFAVFPFEPALVDFGNAVNAMPILVQELGDVAFELLALVHILYFLDF